MSLYEKECMAWRNAVIARERQALKDAGGDSAFVRYKTKINRNKVHNIDRDRLWRRRGYLIWLLTTQGAGFEARIDFVQKAAELTYIEDALGLEGDQRRTHR